MTSGERMVWAAEFARALAAGESGENAALRASGACWELEAIGAARGLRPARAVDLAPDDHVAMIEDMLGVPR